MTASPTFVSVRLEQGELLEQPTASTELLQERLSSQHPPRTMTLAIAFKRTPELLPAPQLGQLNLANPAQALTPKMPSSKTNLTSTGMMKMPAILPDTQQSRAK